MEPLIPVNQRLQLLMRIVNDKFTKKTMRIDEKGNIEFVSDGGDPVSVDQLSSGEQHLLALFTMLLFSAEVGSIVFVDEPEISLHAAWKHEFIKDIEAVAELSKHTVILATHSTSIVNGRWELVQDLSGEME